MGPPLLKFMPKDPTICDSQSSADFIVRGTVSFSPPSKRISFSRFGDVTQVKLRQQSAGRVAHKRVLQAREKITEGRLEKRFTH